MMAKRRTTTATLRDPTAAVDEEPAASAGFAESVCSQPSLSKITHVAPPLEVVPLKLKDVLHKPGEPLQHVYFPGAGGFCSVLTVLQDGGMIEVATIGREGIVGVSAVLDGGRVPYVPMVQAEMDTCHRMTVAAPSSRDGSAWRALQRARALLAGADGVRHAVDRL